MELWTEYEGRTIDGAFPLNKLLLPEGRSAFFSTSNGTGVPTVIRLIASHFDEEEILARWRGVEALGHPNILKIEQYGQLVLDDTTVVYAVFEPVDASLADVIAGQRLTVSEARQLASSLASALEVLHGHGFVHEHVEPANVFAVAEVVKLRGDCIRETPEGATASPVSEQGGTGQAGTGQSARASTAKPAASGSSVAGGKPSPASAKAGPGVREQWRVVAFTYNHVEQAQKKMETIAQKHAALRPEIFTPTGGAPYLVTVGGIMSRDQAFAFAQQARREGLPRDTYAQNYNGQRQ